MPGRIGSGYQYSMQPAYDAAYAAAVRRRRPRKRKVVATKKKSWSSVPSRFRTRSKSQYRKTKAAAKILSLVGETKFQGFNTQGLTGSFGTESAAPQPKPGGTQPLTYVFMNTGGPMAASQNPSQWINMNLFTYPQGDSKTSRDGDYLYIKNSTIKYNIQMLGGVNSGAAGAGVNQGLNSPVLFRLMVVKANRKNMPLGISPSVNTSLFLNTENGSFGLDSTAVSPFQYMNAPINTRQFLTYRDTKFVLSPAGVDFNDQSTASSINTAFGKYKTYKNFNFNLPINKKCHFDDNTNEPNSVDTQWMIILQAVNTGYTLANSSNWSQIGAPRNYSVQCLGTTSALDA